MRSYTVLAVMACLAMGALNASARAACHSHSTDKAHLSIDATGFGPADQMSAPDLTQAVEKASALLEAVYTGAFVSSENAPDLLVRSASRAKMKSYLKKIGLRSLHRTRPRLWRDPGREA